MIVEYGELDYEEPKDIFNYTVFVTVVSIELQCPVTYTYVITIHFT